MATILLNAALEGPIEIGMSAVIFKILRPSEWSEAEDTDFFGGAPVDHADGYIHFSTEIQVAETASKYFSDEPVIHVLAVDTGKLQQNALKWEPSRGGDLFPHLYDRMPMKAVTRVWHLERAANGFDFAPIFEDLRHD